MTQDEFGPFGAKVEFQPEAVTDPFPAACSAIAKALDWAYSHRSEMSDEEYNTLEAAGYAIENRNTDMQVVPR